MKKSSGSVYLLTSLLTAFVAFSFWEMISSNKDALIKLLEISQTSFRFGLFLLGIALSYGFFITINSLLIFLCNTFPKVKKFLLRDMNFDGIWGGGYVYKGEIRLLIIEINQGINGESDFAVNGTVYSEDGKYLGKMNHKSVTADTEKKLFDFTYSASTINHPESMEGLYRGNYSVDKDKMPYKIEGYAFQTKVEGTYNMLTYKLPPEEIQLADSGKQLEYIKEKYFDKLKVYFNVPG